MLVKKYHIYNNNRGKNDLKTRENGGNERECDSDFAALSRMRVKDLRQRLSDLGIDASKFIEKTEMVDAIVSHQRNNKSSISKARIESRFEAKKENMNQQEKINSNSNWGMLSMTSLCLQLKLETDDEWTDVCNSIYCGVSD